MRMPVLAAALLCASSLAHAQPSLTDPDPDTTSVDDKSPLGAIAFSLGGSLVGLGTIYMGSQMHGGDTPMMMIGGMMAIALPSAGEWWASQSMKLTPGLGIRLTGAAIMALGFGAALDRSCDFGPCTSPIRDPESDLVIGMGAAIGVVGMLWDIAAAGHEARVANARRVHVTPTFMQTPSGMVAGLGIAGGM